MLNSCKIMKIMWFLNFETPPFTAKSWTPIKKNAEGGGGGVGGSPDRILLR